MYLILTLQVLKMEAFAHEKYIEPNRYKCTFLSIKNVVRGVYIMPSMVGNIKIDSIGSSGVFNLGDSLYISPKATSRTATGSGSASTGDFQFSTQGINATNTLTPHVADSNVTST